MKFNNNCQLKWIALTELRGPSKEPMLATTYLRCLKAHWSPNKQDPNWAQCLHTGISPTVRINLRKWVSENVSHIHITLRANPDTDCTRASPLPCEIMWGRNHSTLLIMYRQPSSEPRFCLPTDISLFVQERVIKHASFGTTSYVWTALQANLVVLCYTGVSPTRVIQRASFGTTT